MEAPREEVQAATAGRPRNNPFRSLLSRPFVRGVSALMGGTAVRQLIVLIAAPVLTRIYAPEDFGVLAVFTSAVAIGTTICSLSYHLAIPLPERDEVGVNLLALTLLIAALTSALSSGAALLWQGELVAWLKIPQGYGLIWILGPTLIGANTYQALSYWATRKGQFGRVARTKVLQGGGQDAIQIGGGVAGVGAAGLLLGYAAGQVLGVGGLLRSPRPPWREVSPGRILSAARAYRSFPLYSAWAGLINVLGLQVPALLIAHFFGADDVGYFGLSMRVLALPAVLLGQACAQVFYPAAAQRQGRGADLARLTGKVSLLLVVAGTVAFVPVIVDGPRLFTFVFGIRWLPAGHFGQMLAVWSICSMVSSPISAMIFVKGRQRAALFVTCYETALRVGSILVGAALGSVWIAVVLFSASGVIISTVYVLWVFRLSHVPLGPWARSLLGFLAGTVAAVSAAILLGPRLPVLAEFTLLLSALGALAWFGPVRRLLRSA